jgi:hypothetical protein
MANCKGGDRTPHISNAEIKSFRDQKMFLNVDWHAAPWRAAF